MTKSLREAAQALADRMPKGADALNHFHARREVIELRRALEHSADETTIRRKPNLSSEMNKALDEWDAARAAMPPVEPAGARDWVIVCGNSWYGKNGKFVANEGDARGFPSANEAMEFAKGMRCPWSVRERGKI